MSAYLPIKVAAILFHDLVMEPLFVSDGSNTRRDYARPLSSRSDDATIYPLLAYVSPRFKQGMVVAIDAEYDPPVL